MKTAMSVLTALLIAPAAWTPAVAQTSTSTSDWSRVRALPPATEAVVSVTGGGIGTYRICFADDDTLVMARPTGKGLSPAAERAIGAVGVNWPSVLAGNDMVIDNVRVTAHAIIEDGVRVANVMRIPRAVISEVRLPSKATVPDALLFAAAMGAVVGASAASHTPWSQYDAMRAARYDPTLARQPDPLWPPAPRPWPVPAPSDFRDRRPDDRLVVYRRPAGSDPLSEDAVQRLLKSLPSLGRGKQQ